jgi:uncharacterized protein YlxW (UPF0749 family)
LLSLLPLQLNLCGQTPEVILHTAMHALNFHATQQQLEVELREAKLQKKMQTLQAQCTKKLQEVHEGYKAVSECGVRGGAQAEQQRCFRPVTCVWMPACRA